MLYILAILLVSICTSSYSADNADSNPRTITINLTGGQQAVAPNESPIVLASSDDENFDSFSIGAPLLSEFPGESLFENPFSSSPTHTEDTDSDYPTVERTDSSEFASGTLSRNDSSNDLSLRSMRATLGSNFLGRFFARRR